MTETTIKSIINTSIITAFTIAAALIWKDVIMTLIELVVPPSKILVYQILAAIIATIVLVIAITVILKTERGAEHLVKQFQRKK